MSLPQGNFDILFDGVVSIVRAYSATLATEDQFSVHDDYFRPWTVESMDGDHVFIFLASLDPDPKRSGAWTYHEYTVGIWLEVISIQSGAYDVSEKTYVTSDAMASRRCRRLVQALMSVLYKYSNLWLNTTPGEVVSRRPMINVQPYPPQALESEKAAVGMRINLDVGTVFEPTTDSGIDLELISVSANGDNAFGADVDVPQS